MTTFPGNPLNTRYVSLATFRRDGREVRTPVWFAQDENHYFYVFSAGNAGKVKRIRANGRVRFAPCDARGEITFGHWFYGQARILEDDSQRKQALRALHKKYGWQLTIANLLAKLTGRFRKRAYIEITSTLPPGMVTIIGVGPTPS